MFMLVTTLVFIFITKECLHGRQQSRKERARAQVWGVSVIRFGKFLERIKPRIIRIAVKRSTCKGGLYLGALKRNKRGHLGE